MMQPFQGCDLRGAIPRVALFESRNPGLDDSIPLGLWEMGDAITAKLCEQDDSIALWLCERDGSITAGFCERLFAADWFGISGKLSRGVRFLFLFLLASFASASVSLAQDKNLGVEFAADFKGAPLFFDTLSNMNAAGQRLSVTRLDFLVSDFAVRRADGSWLAPSNFFAVIKAREGRTNFEVPGISGGQYDRVRFHVGLEPAVNHKDPAGYAAGNPLNPEVNGLHWGWAGGYVFLALEGSWLTEQGKVSGYSYHLANDPQLMAVELPVSFDAGANEQLRLSLDVDKILNAVTLSEATDSTHSRTNDPLAAKLRDGVERAFAVEPIRANVSTPAAIVARVRREIGSNATPYRLAISRFFPRPDLPADNPLTEEGVALGRKLFNDPRLSRNNSQSCAACHQADAAFSDTNAFSLGADGEAGTRNAMPLLNLAWKSSYFWDGRAPTLREQVLQPIQNPVEMHESLSNVVAKLAADGDYPRLFAAAFGHDEITADRVARALEQFLLVQVSFDSKFDHVIEGTDTFTKEEQRGFELFHTEYDPRRGQEGADCFHCHGGPLFQSQSFANNGLEQKSGLVGSLALPDQGRFAVTGREGDRGKFAVPSLRNVEVTGPYMHDGRFQTLEEVVEHYCTGVQRTATLDPNLAKHPDGGLPLSAADKRALVAFLKTLTDETLRPENAVARAEDIAGR